jgi:tetratricopeptide (TPR) repeat protein
MGFSPPRSFFRRGAALFLAIVLAACSHRPSDAERGIDAFQRGYAALMAKDYARAESWFGEAARLLPDDAYTQLDLGVTEQNLGKTDAARAAYEKAIELGKDVRPRDVTDPRYAALSVGQLAADDLAAMDGGKPPDSGGAAQR